MNLDQNFEITKVQNGFKYILNGKEFVQTDSNEILKRSIEAMNATVSEMKTGDKYTITIIGKLN